ncbi:hypothetical protein EOD42_22285 [Rhodovarius crocodyli]|uniref:Uncharacterized protein n=1 Tax=Rhodovarius crocodyli TaxID=1979269 RepID=A0A437M1B7_9PROT|nr:hypothetical protein [Rhodovarius crocodyli]RVT91386.1 hypothetical protein EOD42_22285 [Rhodovarius crocodyli]
MKKTIPHSDAAIIHMTERLMGMQACQQAVLAISPVQPDHSPQAPALAAIKGVILSLTNDVTRRALRVAAQQGVNLATHEVVGVSASDITLFEEEAAGGNPKPPEAEAADSASPAAPETGPEAALTTEETKPPLPEAGC